MLHAIWSQGLILNSEKSYASFLELIQVPFGYKMTKMMDLQKMSVESLKSYIVLCKSLVFQKRDKHPSAGAFKK